MKTLTKR